MAKHTGYRFGEAGHLAIAGPIITIIITTTFTR